MIARSRPQLSKRFVIGRRPEMRRRDVTNWTRPWSNTSPSRSFRNKGLAAAAFFLNPDIGPLPHFGFERELNVALISAVQFYPKTIYAVGKYIFASWPIRHIEENYFAANNIFSREIKNWVSVEYKLKH